MTDLVQEQLLGHLLGALDDSEHELIAARLEREPRLREQLAAVRQRIEPLSAGRWEYPPPPGLAERTCRFVASHSRRQSHLPQSASHLPKSPGRLPKWLVGSGRRSMSAAAVPPSWIGRIRWVDLAVAAGILAAASLLVLPAIQASRSNARLLACQDNLRQLGLALTKYSTHNGDYFPNVPTKGNLAAAGIYAPTLLRDGYLTDARQVVCPGSPLADREGLHIPTYEELQAASPDELGQLHECMGGSYGYGLGHMDGGTYRDTKNLRRPGFAIMADAPSNDRPDHQSANHDGRGQNVLTEDGAVRLVRHPRLNPRADDFFTNDDGFVAAGLHAGDSVIGSSSSPPIIWVNNR